MSKTDPNIAKKLIRKYNIPVKQARYSNDGGWYHHLENFPAAFLDSNGYIIFQTEEEYNNCSHLSLGQDVNIPHGISSIPGYMTYDSGLLQPLSEKDNAKGTYEFPEGGTREIILELKKRDPALKSHAIDTYGLNCQICNFNFEQFYGNIGAGYIEIHHIHPLSAGDGERTTTVNDVAIVCANCHRILHRNGAKPLSIVELKNAITIQRKSQK